MSHFRVNTPATVYPSAEACRSRGGSEAPTLIGYIHGEVPIHVAQSVYPLVGRNPKPTGEDPCRLGSECCVAAFIDRIRLSHPPHK